MSGLMIWLLASPLVFGLGALLSVASRRHANTVGPAFAALGCALCGVLAVVGLSSSTPPSVVYAWGLPIGALKLAIDPLSAWFLAPVAALGGLTAIYGRGYLAGQEERKNLGFAWLSFNLTLGGMVTVLLARDAVLFLMAWELMSLAAWLAMSFEQEREEVRSAGWVYLVATHAGTAALIVLFLMMRQTPDLGPASGALLALALVGFGAKAGFVPLHLWLPGAHASAPSHVSALMSGALVKMGIYGLLRVLLILGPPPVRFAGALMAVGLCGALLGIGLAISQRDLKRVLAYSTVENLGIIAAALGLACYGWTRQEPLLAALGWGAALLHVWNHAAMKGLMFLCAGSVVHSTGTRDLEQLGGLLKKMPWTGALFVLGGVAIAGLPPLNGFVGEWLLMLGLMKGSHIALQGAVGVLSLVAALAALCFLRLIGVALLGAPRAAIEAHESPASMLVPMGILGLLCVVLGTGGGAALGVAAVVVGQFTPAAALPSLGALSAASAALWGGLALGALGLAALLRRRPVARAETWGCGYTAPNARMQYTARSFAELPEGTLMPAALRPRGGVSAPTALFPTPGRGETDYTDPALRGVFRPFFQRWSLRLEQLRRFQQGSTWQYVAYIGAAFVLALVWSSVRDGGTP